MADIENVIVSEDDRMQLTLDTIYNELRKINHQSVDKRVFQDESKVDDYLHEMYVFEATECEIKRGDNSWLIRLMSDLNFFEKDLVSNKDNLGEKYFDLLERIYRLKRSINEKMN